MFCMRDLSTNKLAVMKRKFLKLSNGSHNIWFVSQLHGVATFNLENSGALSLGQCWQTPFPGHSSAQQWPTATILDYGNKNSRVEHKRPTSQYRLLPLCISRNGCELQARISHLKNQNPYCQRVMNHSPHGRNVEESDPAHMVALVLHRACSSMHFLREVQWGKHAMGAWLADCYFVLATGP